MDAILEAIQDQESFTAFIDENMRLSDYVPLWKSEIPDSDIEYSDNATFSTYTAEYGRAVVASLIEKNANKPIRNTPTMGQITGSIGRMGNKWQLDNDRLRTLRQMEGRFRDNSDRWSAAKRTSEWMKMVKFLFDSYEIAAISPHKRLDLLYFEGVSNGTMTVDLANNPDGIQITQIDLKIKTYGASVVWNTANAATMKGISDLRRMAANAPNGKIIKYYRMTPATFQILANSAEFNQSVKLNLGTLTVDPVGLLGVDKVNQYLAGIDIAPIRLETKIVAISEDEDVNAFQDNRVVAQYADSLAKMIVTDPLELVDPHPNKLYSSYEDNLISSYRTEEGRFLENEMWATPVFTGAKNYSIMKVDTVQS